MALLQIAEPGFSPAPHQHRNAIGIDLGTTNSLVATVKSGSAIVLPDSEGRSLLPSVVRYLDDQGQVEVGHKALYEQSRDPGNTIASVKRLMGRGREDIDTQGSLPYRFVDTPGMAQLVTRAGIKSPVEVSAEILRVLKLRAEGMQLSGPYPADTMFTPPILAQGDAVLAMYHDQGLTALKYATFGKGINVTLGLPIIRTSVDHGTALELTGTGKADPGSLFEAVAEAARMASRKKQ